MKKRISLLLVVVLAISLFAGCGKTAAPAAAAPAAAAPADKAEAAPAAAEPYVGAFDPDWTSGKTPPSVDKDGNQIEVAIVPPALESPFYQQCIDAAKPYADAWGWKLTVMAPDDTEDYAGQVAMCEDLIQKGCDGLIVCSLDVTSIITAIKAANDAGIPFVLFNTVTDSEDGVVYAYSGYDQRQAGAKMADWIAATCGEDCTVGCILGLPGLHSNERHGGFMDRVNEAYPNITVSASQSASWSRQEAMDTAINMIQADPSIQAFFCCNDDMALGATQGMMQIGRTDVVCIGLDANPNALESIKAGKLTASCFVGAPEQGANAIMAMADALLGIPAPADNKLYADIAIIDASNVDEYLK